MDNLSEWFHNCLNTVAKKVHKKWKSTYLIHNSKDILICHGLWKMTYLAHFRGTHHVPEMGTQSSCSLVVLHHTVIVEDFSTAFTVAENKQSLQSFTMTIAFNSTLLGGCESLPMLIQQYNPINLLHMKGWGPTMRNSRWGLSSSFPGQFNPACLADLQSWKVSTGHGKCGKRLRRLWIHTSDSTQSTFKFQVSAICLWWGSETH